MTRADHTSAVGFKSRCSNANPAVWQGVLLGFLLSISPGVLFAQGSAGSGGKVEPRYLVDVPTAGMLEKGSLALDLDFYQGGGVLAGISIGILNRLSLGVSYGGSRLIGSEAPEMNQIPGVNLKIRVIEESLVLPALAIGFDSQGRDGYIKSLSRYAIKSPGLYAALSKNYSMLGFLSIHGGVNYSFERADEHRDVNVFAGVEKTIGPTVSIVADYNLATNDSGGEAGGKGRGYLNAAIKWSLSAGLTFSLNFKDLMENSNNLSSVNRTVRFEYVRNL